MRLFYILGKKDLIFRQHILYLKKFLNELPRSKLRGISLAEFIDLIEASFEEFDPKRLNFKKVSSMIHQGTIEPEKIGRSD
jgi:hypothetical protein